MPAVISSTRETTKTVAFPEHFLNAYELTFQSRTPWKVALYAAAKSNQKATHQDRGSLRNAVWEYRKLHKATCPGPHCFVVDVDSDTVAVPDSWRIKPGVEVNGYCFKFIRVVDVNLDDSGCDAIIRGLLRDGFKNALKSLDDMWQNYNAFCQIPSFDGDEDFVFCRQIGAEVAVLRGRKWCLQVRVSTQTVDRRTFDDHFVLNRTETLAEWINLKRNNRRTRKNRPPDIGVLRMQRAIGSNIWTAKRYELNDPDAIVDACLRVAKGDRRAWRQLIACKQFGKGILEIPADEMHLILDPQITQEDHRETILQPSERTEIWCNVRSILHQTEVFGSVVNIAEEPIDIGGYPGGVVAPPAIRIRDKNGETVLVSPKHTDATSLRQRGRERSQSLKRHGLLQSRPMNPILACPSSKYSKARAERLLYDVNALLEEQNLPFRIPSYGLYQDAQAIERMVLDGGFDCAFVVLPEGRSRPQTASSFHEQIKRLLAVPSQCIHFDNTYHDKSNQYQIPNPDQSDGRLPSRFKDNYVNCIWGLAIKNHCVPYAPAEAFHYNTHIAIDVGGRDNNKAMFCIGHGFCKPRERLIFLAEELPVDGAKAEPIPVQALVDGIIAGLAKVADGLKSSGKEFDLQTLLFIRDGPMLGEREHWNEQDACEPIFAEAKRRGWVKDGHLWTLAEVNKSAEGWRALDYKGKIGNPLVGWWIAPFDDPNRIILATTGEPYLTQGTAAPLLIQVRDLFGSSKREDVIRDIVWEADMCFTKPDMGMRLPWVLYVANEGALQAARSYEITGIPV